MVWLSWKLSAEEIVTYVTHTNEAIGAYVTAGARIHLYSFLDRQQENAIYCDTDSVIFIQPIAEPCPIATEDKVGVITLNYQASTLVNFEVIRAITLEKDEPIGNVHTENKMKRKRRAGGTEDIVKT